MKSFSQYVEEGRSIGTVPASVNKKISKHFKQLSRNPFRNIGIESEKKLNQIKADYEQSKSKQE